MPQPKRIYHGWWIVLAAFILAAFVGGAIFTSITAFVEPLVREFGWSYTQISFVLTIRGLEVGLFSIIIGFMVDRFGARFLILFGTATISLGLFSFSRTNSLLWFVASFILLSFGAGGVTSVVLTTAITRWFQKNMGKALGITACGFGAGGLLVPVVVWLIGQYHWRATAVIVGIGMILIGVPAAIVIRDKPGPNDYIPEGEITTAPIEHPKTRSDREARVFREALANRTYWYINFAEAIRMMIMSSVTIHVMPYLDEIGFSRHTAGLITAAIPIISITGRLSFGWLGDLLNKKMVLAASHVLMGIGVLAFSFARIHWLVVPFLIFFSIGFGGSMPLRGLIISEYFGIEAMGKLLGVSMSVAAAGGVIGPILAGWIFDHQASYRLAWHTFTGLTIVSAFFIARIPRSGRASSAYTEG